MDKKTFTHDIELKALKATDKEYALTDSITKGLQIIVATNGNKRWAYRYSSPTLKYKNGKTMRRRKGLGAYPNIPLVSAREKVRELQKIINSGIDPMDTIQAEKQQCILDDKSQLHKVVYQWIDEVLESRDKPNTISQIKRVFEKDIFPRFVKYNNNREIISSMHIGDIHHSEILDALRIKAIVSPELANKALGWCRRVWVFATSHGYCENNVIYNISKEVLPKRKKNHHPKIVDEKILGQLLGDIDVYKGNIITRCALKLYPFTMLRAENMTTLRWEMIDFDNKLLTIPRDEMKVKDKNLNDFKLPLTDTAIAILNEIKPFTGWGKWVFHGVHDFGKPLNIESCNKALRVMGYDDIEKGTKQTQHSFRGTYRSLVETYADKHRMSFEVKEAVLDHHEKSQVVRAYMHKADYTEQMRELLEWWEIFLLGLKREV
ncbi:MAG: integrase arm-type DNA-binding domain-containing protein [Sulfurovaceae bacterium]